jgi:hypothetical protein
MTGFWDGVYHGIRDDKLDKEVILRLIMGQIMILPGKYLNLYQKKIMIQ